DFLIRDIFAGYEMTCRSTCFREARIQWARNSKEFKRSSIGITRRASMTSPTISTQVDDTKCSTRSIGKQCERAFSPGSLRCLKDTKDGLLLPRTRWNFELFRRPQWQLTTFFLD